MLEANSNAVRLEKLSEVMLNLPDRAKALLEPVADGFAKRFSPAASSTQRHFALMAITALEAMRDEVRDQLEEWDHGGQWSISLPSVPKPKFGVGANVRWDSDPDNVYTVIAGRYDFDTVCWWYGIVLGLVLPLQYGVSIETTETSLSVAVVAVSEPLAEDPFIDPAAPLPPYELGQQVRVLLRADVVGNEDQWRDGTVTGILTAPSTGVLVAYKTEEGPDEGLFDPITEILPALDADDTQELEAVAS